MLVIETWFLDIITKIYDVMGWPGVVFLMGIESAAIPFPSELIMPLAGWLLIEAKGDSAWMLGMVCDFVIASDDAVFAHNEQRLGASGTMWTLPLSILHCGPKKARELHLTGRDFGAEEAERLNLINRVVPADKLEEEVEALTKSICLLPRDGLAIGKAYTNMTYDLLRMVSPFLQYTAAHPLVVGMKWAPDEISFVKERRDSGVRDAAHKRAERFSEEYT